MGRSSDRRRAELAKRHERFVRYSDALGLNTSPLHVVDEDQPGLKVLADHTSLFFWVVARIETPVWARRDRP